MKKFFLALIASFALAPAVGLCALVQAVGHDLGHVTTGTVTIAATTAGDTLVVGICGYTGAVTVSSVTAGGATSSTADYALATASNGPLAIFSIPNVAGGITSVSITQSTTEWTVAIVIEESGLLTTPSKDKSTGQNQNGVTAWSSGLTGTTTQASEIGFGFFCVGTGTSQVVTPDTGWSLLSGTGIDANGQAQETTAGLTLGGIRRVLSATGTYQASGTGPNAAYGTIISTYKVSSGGPAVPPSQFFLSANEDYFRDLIGER